MSENNVPNQEEKENAFGNMIIEPELNPFKEVINLRNGAYDKMSNEEKVEANQKISQGISKIMALAESYPDLKANENFKDLSNELSKIEEDIANSRKYYNATVRQFNTKAQMFPTNIVANMFNFKSKKMFEATENERENVKVEF